MIIAYTIQEYNSALHTLTNKKHSTSIGFVPTMGALHKGHTSLIQKSLTENAITVVSIFLNPTQFNNQEDFAQYPVSLADDCELLESMKVDILFAPTNKDMYPNGYHFRVQENKFSTKLCGSARPGHFDGVLTVVLKLFHIVKPNRAYFGEKDWQQYILIKQMVEAFFLDIDIIPCPIIRENNGLAISSRNRLLSTEATQIAPKLYKALSSKKALTEIRKTLESCGFTIDYLEVHEARLFAAVFLEKVRLIDNVPY